MQQQSRKSIRNAYEKHPTSVKDELIVLELTGA